MQNVLVQSGGEAVWRGIRSVEENFSVLGAGEKTPHVMLLLNNWSLDMTLYRRGLEGQSRPPSNHYKHTHISLEYFRLAGSDPVL
jgi:hypothetical protein